MKKWIKIAGLLILTFPLAVPADDFTYITNADNTITITGYTGSGGNVTIPDTTNGLPVTVIGFGAFKSCTNLISVTIPKSVTSIGEGFTLLGPDGEYGAFKGCTSLTAISVDASNTVYSSVDGVLFNKNKSSLIQCPGGKTGTYIIPNSVTDIGLYAFQRCTSLTAVKISDNVTIIGYYAFETCTSLTNVTIGNSVTSICVGAFQNCASLSSITIPKSVTNIAIGPFFLSGGGFSGCTNLTTITVEALNPVYSSVDGILFNKDQTSIIRCPEGKTETYTMPSGIISIGIGAFSGCFRLTNVTISTSVVNIAEAAFSECTGLTSITIPNSVTHIGNDGGAPPFMVVGVFSGCTSLTKVYFLGNVPSLDGSPMFTNADNVTVYYLTGMTGWEATFAGVPTALWNPLIHASGEKLGVQTNGFSFNVTGIADHVVVVEACTNLAEGVWVPVETNTLTGGSIQFSDPAWSNYPNRYYRVSMPQ